MHLVKGDTVELQAPETAFQSFHNPLRAGVPKGFPLPIPSDAKLRSNDGVLPLGAERPAEDFLRVPEAVHVRSIKKVNTQIQGLANGANRVPIINLSPTVAANGPTTESDPRDSQVRAP